MERGIKLWRPIPFDFRRYNNGAGRRLETTLHINSPERQIRHCHRCPTVLNDVCSKQHRGGAQKYDGRNRVAEPGIDCSNREQNQ